MTVSTDVINVQRLLDERRLTPAQWGVFALCFLTVLLDGFDTAAIGYIAPSLIKAWGVSRPALAPVLSAALLGLAAGALSAGPLADVFGRKRVLVGSVSLFALAALASSQSGDLSQLTLWRFVTGIGLGAAMPNAVTLTSEYCPTRRRALLTNLMFCGFPLGAALGGFLAAWLIPAWGWPSVLVVGGVAPLVLAVLLALALPESIRHLVARRASGQRIRQMLERMTGPLPPEAQHFSLDEDEPAGGDTRQGLALVMSPAYRLGSLLLWLTYFMGLVIFYALINWMPILFKDAGLDPRSATLMAALFPLGGIGAVFSGWLMDRLDATRVLAVAYALTAVSIWAIGQSAGHGGALVLAVLVAGVLMNTAQASMPALAAGVYPTRGRATGVAWMLGIGRFGGIAGSFLVAELSARQVGFAGVFTTVAMAGVLAALALLGKSLHERARG